MQWWIKLQAHFRRHYFVSELANWIIKIAVLALIFGVTLWAPLGWAGLAGLVSGLILLAYSDTLLPNYGKDKEDVDNMD